MRILFATGRMLYPFFRGGDGTSAYEMLTALSRFGLKCLALGVLNPSINAYPETYIVESFRRKNIPYFIKGSGYYYWNEIENRLVTNDMLEQEVVRTILEFKPDVVLTQMEGSDLVIKSAKSLNVPSILFVHDISKENQKSLEAYGLSYVFYNSKFVLNYFKDYHSIPHEVLYPIVDASLYIASVSQPKYITMINPTESKGYYILKECCKTLIHIPFQVISGWSGNNLKKEGFQNVALLGFNQNMKEIYGSTLFMIIPSQAYESFCRLPVEAGLNSIPSIASRIGGLPESVGLGGILISDYSNADSWMNEIASLYSNLSLIEELGKLAKINSMKFVSANRIDNLIDIIKNLSKR